MERISLKTLEAALNSAPTKIQGMLVERAILRSAFALVENPGDSRGAIDAKVHVDCCDFEPDVLIRAVAFFTATNPTVEEKDGYLYVKAAGYRAGPAGDH